MPTKQRDRLVASILIVFAVVVFAYTYTFPAPSQALDPGVAAMPRLMLGTIFVLALVPLIRPQECEKLPRGSGVVRILGTIVLLLAYAFAIDELGFVISTAVFLVAELLLIGVRHWLPLVAMPLVTSFGLYYLFRAALDVPLPRGGFGGIPF